MAARGDAAPDLAADRAAHIAAVLAQPWAAAPSEAFVGQVGPSLWDFMDATRQQAPAPERGEAA